MNGKLSCGHATIPLNEKLLSDLKIADYHYFKGFQTDLYFLSGVRCEECNKKAGGVNDSEHETGEGVDIWLPTNSWGTNAEKIYFLIAFFITLGYNRFGINETSLHVGCSKTLPQNRIWTYYKTARDKAIKEYSATFNQ